jgi:hypothetical protein
MGSSTSGPDTQTYSGDLSYASTGSSFEVFDKWGTYTSNSFFFPDVESVNYDFNSEIDEFIYKIKISIYNAKNDMIQTYKRTYRRVDSARADFASRSGWAYNWSTVTWYSNGLKASMTERNSCCKGPVHCEVKNSFNADAGGNPAIWFAFKVAMAAGFYNTPTDFSSQEGAMRSAIGNFRVYTTAYDDSINAVVNRGSSYKNANILTYVQNLPRIKEDIAAAVDNKIMYGWCYADTVTFANW